MVVNNDSQKKTYRLFNGYKIQVLSHSKYIKKLFVLNTIFELVFTGNILTSLINYKKIRTTILLKNTYFLINKQTSYVN